MLQSLFKDCPEKAFQFVKSLCLGGQNINRFQTWQLMEFVELCSEHDCPDLLEKLSGYNLSYNLSAKIAAHKAFIGVKSGEWTVPDKDDRRFFHLTMLQLAGIVATQKDSSYAKKLIKLAEAQYNPYYLEFTYVCLIVMGYNKKIPYILSQKLTDQNVANIRASVYRTAFDADSLITADKTMRAVKTTSLKWQITLNFYLFRQAIYLVSSKRCLSALYDYLLEQFNRINPEENYPETKDWLDLLTDAHKSGNFATIDLECEKLRQQKKKRFQKTRSSNDELATFFD
uniref:DNA-(Apurinic or apyrimidinic site) lyase-like n=1 Tax=Phallusia mammillata TaxID=59560 RepID=A0A6F9D6S9_9ASCI|nr:DNA-(apurinic or apyrimidinic site) lyase-like [Phallusia mammillata]